MSAPFIALTLPAMGGLAQRPVFINASLVREVTEQWQRKAGHNAAPTPADYEIAGTLITTGSGEEGTFSVIEGYVEVIVAIRDALS